MSHKVARSWKWILIGLATVPAIRVYYVQEMIAALVIFSVLFVCVAAAVLIIFLLDRASQHIIAWAEAGVAQIVRRAVNTVEGIIARPAWVRAGVPHRYRRGQLKDK